MKRYYIDDDHAAPQLRADGEWVYYEDAMARIAALERAIRAANEAVCACEGIGLLYCMGEVSEEAKTIAAVLAKEGT